MGNSKLSLDFIIHVLTPVGVGLLIYVLSRGSSDLEVGKLVTLMPFINLPEWLKFNLPDGIWLYSLLWSIYLVQRTSPPIERLLWLNIAIVLAFALEILQFVEDSLGTFDILDILIMVFATALFFLLTLNKIY